MARIKRKNVYLVDNYEEDINGSKLPSNKQVLCFFLHNHNILQEGIRDSATKTVEKVAKFCLIRQEFPFDTSKIASNK